MEYSTIRELVQLAEEKGTRLSEIVIQVEMEDSGLGRDEIEARMFANLQVMKESVREGKKGEIKSASGLIGGDARKIMESERWLGSDIYRQVVISSLAVSEVNAGMGKVVAGPTAGSSGIVPALILAVGERLELPDKDLVSALFTAAGFGSVIARTATLAGAAGGCQAECGAASAMAAGAGVELCNGTPEMSAHAFALALKNLLGLVCDPVAGLVEVPCVKRNGFAATHALTAVNMALAGVKSAIPPDEVIEAMSQIGSMMPVCLKETAGGGLAVTPTGLEIKERIR